MNCCLHGRIFSTRLVPAARKGTCDSLRNQDMKKMISTCTLVELFHSLQNYGTNPLELPVCTASVSVTVLFLWGEVVSPTPNPQPEGPVCCFSSGLYPETCPAWLILPGIALSHGDMTRQQHIGELHLPWQYSRQTGWDGCRRKSYDRKGKGSFQPA